MDEKTQPNPAAPPDAESQGEGVNVNRQHKDRVIRKIFGESKENALSLYNAVNDRAYTNADDLEFNTIGDSLYMGMRNDISFLLGMEVNLYEHQSTVCPNMPFRGLNYVLAVLNAYAHTRDLNIYGEKLQRFPTPKYVVLYNGEKEAPDCETLRFTDAVNQPEASCLEMRATVYNINYGRNRELMSKCKPLRDYSILVDMIRRYKKEGMSLEDAINRAVDECIREDVLREFLIKHKTEVAGMFQSEYDEAERLRLEKKESLEEGIVIGEQRGIEIGEKKATNSLVGAIQNLMKDLGMTVDAAINVLGIPAEEHQKYASLASQQRMPNT